MFSLTGQARPDSDFGLKLSEVPSVHVNFAERGIPAFRLLAGFERPTSALRFLPTGKDSRNLVASPELRNGVAVAGAVLFRAINAPSEELLGLRARR
ncbi:hypothetical protein QD409_22585 [Rhizobium sp. BR 315]|uniref:Uncharacterized protein n=1 Tax=Rhizobium miluonense TaxID=411945 RepID=A0A1C3WI06_9HYPH|nr:hypothetical protein GA0061102_103064 [Rhizobium miluonense]